MSEDVEKFTYGNIMTGEMKETRMRILILPAKELYDKFLKEVLERYNVKSPHPLVVYAQGNFIIVISGDGLKCNKCEGQLVKGKLRELWNELQKYEYEYERVLEEIFKYWFEEYFEEDFEDEL